MRSIIAVARRILTQFILDKRTLALLFVAPLVVIWLLSILLSADTVGPKIATVDLPQEFQQQLEKTDARIDNTDMSAATQQLEDNRIAAVLSMESDDTLRIWLEGTDSSKAASVLGVVAEALGDMRKEASKEIETTLEQRKADAEKALDDAEAKQEEIRETVDGFKAEIEQKRADTEEALEESQEEARRKQEEILQKQQEMQDKLRTAIQRIVISLPAEQRASVSEQLSGLMAEMSAMTDMDFGESDEAAAGISIDDFSIEMPSELQDLIDDADSTDIGISLDDFDFDMAEYMPIQETEEVYLHGSSDWKMFDYYGPIFIGIFLFAFTFITSGMSLVTERSAGTMARFLATPINSAQILGGYTLAFGLLALIQSTVILWVSLTFIGFPCVGSIWLVVLVCVSMAMVSVTLGLFVSGLAHTSFQVIQLILLFVVPQILLCGMFDLSGAPEWMQALSYCMPVTYGVDALRAVMLRGADFAAVGLDMGVLWGFLAAFFILAAVGFRKKRAPRQMAGKR